MNKQQMKRLATPMAIIVVLVFIYLIPTAFSQDDMTQVPVTAFTVLERPQVAFNHDMHNEKAEIDDCVVCHHGRTDDGAMDMENSSEGESCDSCHLVKPENGETPLMRAYHRQCIACHVKSLKGPVTCGECHTK
ncbi:acidic tetraheme cytochrome c3 TmcA [Pseudodesulfovibrio piezophilus]|uniref:Acidic cytochrome c3 n=1 Tax=Pseudodesulfovibrio piezophilus (strain DSM 21447 / JCM 15486 / C1TLV30) TaxID=1322246 RepID=M1WR92_PSEP2|nr:cytochrome c3 family protein [Pseudodesulfovibrio piezophilus]CCH48182.1 Acidic cytochrome c3 [Pseudodesulfovibrio piezophilus C1TLV30]